MYDDFGFFFGPGLIRLATDDAIDRRSGQLDLVVVFEVPDNRVGAGIETSSSELLAESDHDLDDFSRRGVGSCSWPSRSWSERAVAPRRGSARRDG
jgi:hypothetical protein